MELLRIPGLAPKTRRGAWVAGDPVTESKPARKFSVRRALFEEALLEAGKIVRP